MVSFMHVWNQVGKNKFREWCLVFTKIYLCICHLHLCMFSKYMNNNICCFLSAVKNELKKHWKIGLEEALKNWSLIIKTWLIYIWSFVLIWSTNYISDICTHYHTCVTVFVFLMWLSHVCFRKLSTLLYFCQQGWGKNCLKF